MRCLPTCTITRTTRVVRVALVATLLVATSRPARAEDNALAETKRPIEDLVVDLTALAREGKLDPAIGVDETIGRLRSVLSRRLNNAAVILGEAGVGKTAVVEEFARRVASGQIPEFAGFKVWNVDVNDLVAGAAYRGSFENRIGQLADAVRSKPIIVFIDELHGMVGAGRSTGNRRATGDQLLKPVLARATLGRFIGATTAEEYRAIIAGDDALRRRLTPVFVDEPSDAQTFSILRGIRETLQQHHGVQISDRALKAAVRFGRRFIRGKANPDKSITLVDEAGAAMQMAPGDGSRVMGVKEIKAAVRDSVSAAATAYGPEPGRGRATRLGGQAGRWPSHRVLWQRAAH